MTRLGTALVLAGLALAGAAQAETRAYQLFGAEKAGSANRPDPIGSYAKGCAAGMVELPETGPTWQAMRLSRNRNWGHPEAIAFIKRLSAYASTQPGWKGLYIGDIGQPRGGPMLSGHASHQIGLDIDIWLLPPRSLALSPAEREAIGSPSVRSADQRRVTSAWTPQHAAILEAAARDPAVDRIFITPPAKIAMCNSRGRGDDKWLQKIRPLYGHDSHFHVRLKCPEGSRYCVTQSPTVADLSKGGSGCDETLTWWVTDYLNPPKTAEPAKPAPKERGPKDFTLADLPNECRAVLTAP